MNEQVSGDFDTTELRANAPWKKDIGQLMRENYAIQTFQTEAAPVVNPSGITPTEFKVLVLPSPIEEVTKGGIIVPIDKVDKDKYATTDGVLVAMSHLAFTYVTDEEWGDQKPKPGMKVVFAKYAGSRRKGKDGLDYILINDKDIVATIED